MITVAIFINGNPIMARSAVNTGTARDDMTVYRVDDGSEILHDNGMVALAKKLLDTIKEPGAGDRDVGQGTKKYECGQCQFKSSHHPSAAGRSWGIRCPACGSRNMLLVSVKDQEKAAKARAVRGRVGGVVSTSKGKRRSRHRP